MGKNAQKTWARRWCQMRASGVLPAAGPAGEYTRAEWDAYAAKRELEGQTLTI
jgi:hypothetical protein